MKNRTLLDSFKYASQGMKSAFTGERNFRIHCIAAGMVILLGIVFQITPERWALVVLAMGFVFASELLNTVAESIVDMITKEYSKEAKRVKDLAAAAVFVSAMIAVFVGIFVFAEPILQWVTGNR